MATYSTGYQFKLISTGEDPDTWGIGTNENFEKIEAAVGRAVEVDINPATAPSSYSGTTTGVFTWVTDSASLACVPLSCMFRTQTRKPVFINL